MNQVLRIRVPGAFAGLLCAIACGGSYNSPGGDAPALKLATSTRVGNYLVDGNGRSVYFFGEDLPASGSKAAVSNCSDACAAAWPSFHAGSLVVQGIGASDVGEITRSDGSKQTTYQGWPLYFYVGDARAGDLNGEGVGNILEAEKFPDATLRVSRSELTFPKQREPAQGTAKGELTLHGRSRPVEVHYRAELSAGGITKVRGSLLLDMRDFGIEYPSYLGVTVAPVVEVRVELAMKGA